MSPTEQSASSADRPSRAPYQFTTTHWSVVLATRESGGAAAAAALESLCAAYWRPLWECARRMGYKPDEADDAVQGFFEDVLERNAITAADPARGRFRTFLLTCFQNFLRNYQKHVTRAKRGGAAPAISLQAETIDHLELPEFAQAAPPEQVYDLHWARTVVERALEVVRNDYASSGRGRLFDALRPVIWGGQLVPLSQIALQLGQRDPGQPARLHKVPPFGWPHRYSRRVRSLERNTD